MQTEQQLHRDLLKLLSGGSHLFKNRDAFSKIYTLPAAHISALYAFLPLVACSKSATILTGLSLVEVWPDYR